MDAHSFHSITRELIVFLQGARIEKIHGPLPHTFLFSLFAQKQKWKLLFSAQKNSPCLCLTKQTIANPQNPRADVMRLRKFIMGKRLVQGHVHFTTRRLAFALSSAPETPPLYLIFDWKNGLLLENALPDDFFTPPLWPAAQVICATYPPHLSSAIPANSASPFSGSFIETPASPSMEQPASSSPNSSVTTPFCSSTYISSGSSTITPSKNSATSPADSTALWQQYTILTPMLREVLPYLPPTTIDVFFEQLALGNSPLYCYIDAQNTLHCTAFSLPAQIQNKKRLKEVTVTPTLFEGEMALEIYMPEQTVPFVTLPLLKGYPSEFVPLSAMNACRKDSGLAKDALPEFTPNETPEPTADLYSTAIHSENFKEPQYFAALTLASWVDEYNFFTNLTKEINRQEIAPEKKQEKKQARLQKKLDQEEKRLIAMVALREQAFLLQQYLWMFTPDAKEAFVEIPLPSTNNSGQDFSLQNTTHSAEQRTNTLRIPLNSQLTICENMEHMFHQSARGLRGLTFLQERRANPNFIPPQTQTQHNQQGTNKQERLTNYTAVHRKKGEQKHVAKFISSEGFTILRGKNAEGNKAIIKMGQPHDIWLHSKDGPSAHALVRRAHSAQEVPEATLEEASILVGLKSWQKDDRKAEIMLAEIRHVRGHKGRYAGAALANKLLGILLVTLNQELETTLLTE